MQAIILILFLIFATPANATDPWSRGDTYREVAALTLRLIDYRTLSAIARVANYKTTLQIAKHPNEYREANPLLGEHPSVGEVNTFFIIATVAHPIISYALPKEYRKAFQYISIGASGTASITNVWSGLKIRF
mgnify:CR=1 FL=1